MCVAHSAFLINRTNWWRSASCLGRVGKILLVAPRLEHLDALKTMTLALAASAALATAEARSSRGGAVVAAMKSLLYNPAQSP